MKTNYKYYKTVNNRKNIKKEDKEEDFLNDEFYNGLSSTESECSDISREENDYFSATYDVETKEEEKERLRKEEKERKEGKKKKKKRIKVPLAFDIKQIVEDEKKEKEEKRKKQKELKMKEEQEKDNFNIFTGLKNKKKYKKKKTKNKKEMKIDWIDYKAGNYDAKKAIKVFIKMEHNKIHSYNKNDMILEALKKGNDEKMRIRREMQENLGCDHFLINNCHRGAGYYADARFHSDHERRENLIKKLKIADPNFYYYHSFFKNEEKGDEVPIFHAVEGQQGFNWIAECSTPVAVGKFLVSGNTSIKKDNRNNIIYGKKGEVLSAYAMNLINKIIKRGKYAYIVTNYSDIGRVVYFKRKNMNNSKIKVGNRKSLISDLFKIGVGYGNCKWKDVATSGFLRIKGGCSSVGTLKVTVEYLKYAIIALSMARDKDSKMDFGSQYGKLENVVKKPEKPYFKNIHLAVVCEKYRKKFKKEISIENMFCGLVLWSTGLRIDYVDTVPLVNMKEAIRICDPDKRVVDINGFFIWRSLPYQPEIDIGDENLTTKVVKEIFELIMEMFPKNNKTELDVIEEFEDGDDKVDRIIPISGSLACNDKNMECCEIMVSFQVFLKSGGVIGVEIAWKIATEQVDAWCNYFSINFTAVSSSNNFKKLSNLVADRKICNDYMISPSETGKDRPKGYNIQEDLFSLYEGCRRARRWNYEKMKRNWESWKKLIVRWANYRKDDKILKKVKKREFAVEEDVQYEKEKIDYLETMRGLIAEWKAGLKFERECGSLNITPKMWNMFQRTKKDYIQLVLWLQASTIRVDEFESLCKTIKIVRCCNQPKGSVSLSCISVGLLIEIAALVYVRSWEKHDSEIENGSADNEMMKFNQDNFGVTFCGDFVPMLFAGMVLRNIGMVIEDRAKEKRNPYKSKKVFIEGNEICKLSQRASNLDSKKDVVWKTYEPKALKKIFNNLGLERRTLHVENAYGPKEIMKERLTLITKQKQQIFIERKLIVADSLSNDSKFGEELNIITMESAIWKNGKKK